MTKNTSIPKSKSSLSELLSSTNLYSINLSSTNLSPAKAIPNITLHSNQTDLSSFEKITDMPRVFSLIVAAGKGSRFGSEVPKQYTPLNGTTILQQSVNVLALSQHVKDIFLVIAEDDEIAKTLTYEVPISFVFGGAERWQSVQAGVEAIFGAGANAQDLILIHDAARPCVLPEHIDKVVRVASQQPYGAILGVPVADTVKKVSKQGDITATIDRSHLWQAQTPQVFRAHELRKVLSYIAEHDLMITDEASAFELRGYPIKIVQGNHQNVKLTYAEDLGLIESVLNSRK